MTRLMVIVPTAQSSRNLRLMLAQLGGAILPPKIVMPADLLTITDQRVATEAEEMAFASKTLLEVEQILGENALLVRDVHPSVEPDHWQELVDEEDAFLAALHSHHVLARAEARQLAAKRGCTDPAIDEIIVPNLSYFPGALKKYLDASKVKVTEYCPQPGSGHSCPRLSEAQILTFPTPVLESDAIASFFRAIPSTDALPGLVACDTKMFPELEGAFQNHFDEQELILRNPSRSRVAHSPLGRLLISILALKEKGDYETFSTFIRSGDVVRWHNEDISGLDKIQNEHLPQTIADLIPYFPLAAKVAERLADPFKFLQEIFAGVTLDEANPGDRELIAAAEVIRDLRAAVNSELIPAEKRVAIFTELLKKSTYMLEPTAPNVLASLGWLEVPWSMDEELVFAGLNEGAVPENIVGHPYVPDSLREELGLMTNRRRAERDLAILSDAIASRAPNMVHIFLHQQDSEKNVTKPSRIIFPLIPDEVIPELAKRLYTATPLTTNHQPLTATNTLPAAWRLKLPIPPPGIHYPEKTSPSALDQYYRCPFHYYLQTIFGEHSDDHALELDNMEFGSLVHEVLDEFAKVGPKDCDDEARIADFLERSVWDHLAAFGDPRPAIIELQGLAAIQRLKHFAHIQVEWYRAGWRIIAHEQKLSCRLKGRPTLIRGRVDRIDRNEQTGELMIIDYKTWAKDKKDKHDSLQLALYRAMVEASPNYSGAPLNAIYCVLGETAADVKFLTDAAVNAGKQSELEDKVCECLDGMAKGIFYPPKLNEWTTNYGSLVWQSPEEGIDPAWLEDQKCRR